MEQKPIKVYGNCVCVSSMCVTPNCLVGTLSVHFDNKGVECDTPIWLMFKCNVYRQNETPKSHRAKSSLDNMFILNTLDLFHSVLSKKKKTFIKL